MNVACRPSHSSSTIMTLLPTIVTLFPYTTLFRSLIARLAAEGLDGLEVHYATHSAGEVRMLRCLDRKSTRLNSSHSQISYAVFCLKKKKYYKSVLNI